MASDAATRQSAPNSCWHTYSRSSASQPDNVYRAQGYAYWQVQFREGEGDDWKNFPEGTATQSEALVRRGVDPSRLETVGHGYLADPPQVDAATSALNRRTILVYFRP